MRFKRVAFQVTASYVRTSPTQEPQILELPEWCLIFYCFRQPNRSSNFFSDTRQARGGGRSGHEAEAVVSFQRRAQRAGGGVGQPWGRSGGIVPAAGVATMSLRPLVPSLPNPSQ